MLSNLEALAALAQLLVELRHQARGLEAPSYTVTGREGPDHAPSFRVRAEVARLGAEEATGASKRIAEQAAALSLLTRAEARGGDDQ